MKNRKLNRLHFLLLSIISIACGFGQAIFLFDGYMADTHEYDIVKQLFIPSFIVFIVMFYVGYLSRGKRDAWVVFYATGTFPAATLSGLIAPPAFLIMAFLLSFTIGLSTWLGTRIKFNA